jgi:hypothetical protein
VSQIGDTALSVSFWKPPQYQYHSRIESQKFRERRQQLAQRSPISQYTTGGKLEVGCRANAPPQRKLAHPARAPSTNTAPDHSLIEWALFYIQETVFQSAAVTTVAELEPDIFYTYIACM